MIALLKKPMAATIVGGVLAVVMLSSCSFTSGQTDGPNESATRPAVNSSSGSSSGVGDAEDVATDGDALWTEVLLEFPDAAKPTVSVVDEVSPDTWATSFAACLTELGFPASVDGTAVAVTEPEAGQEEAFAVSRYICLTEYPLEEKYDTPLNTTQIEALYDYQSTELVACLETAGFEIEAPPTKAVYVATYESGSAPWSPYLSLPTLTDDEFDQLNARCPQVPDSIYDISDAN